MTKERNIRRLLLASAVIVLIGIALVGTRSSKLGTGSVIVGALGLIACIHYLGRLGPDDV